MMKKVTGFFKKFKIFDILFICLFLFLAIAFFVFFFRQSKYLTVKLKVTEKNVLYAASTPPSWFVYLFKPGMQEKDGLGRINAEVENVYFYNTSPSTKAAYLTLKLRTTYNGRSKEYKYKGITLAIGEGIRVNLDKVLVEGLIVDVEGLKGAYKESYFQVESLLLMEIGSNFSETTGIDQFYADSIEVGDKIFDSAGGLMVELLKKEVFPAKKNTFDDKGNVYAKNDPRKKDVYLTLKVKAININNEFYFFDDVRLQIGQNLPLHFEKISLYPLITDLKQL